VFPVRDTIRQLAHNFEGIGPKEPKLDRLLGHQWRELYSIVPEAESNLDLFDEPLEPEMKRVVSTTQFVRWLKRRHSDDRGGRKRSRGSWKNPKIQSHKCRPESTTRAFRRQRDLRRQSSLDPLLG
jgi:hypothetical protein